MKAKRLVLCMALACTLMILWHIFTGSYFINNLQNNEFDLLLNNRVLTDVHVVKYPKFMGLSTKSHRVFNSIKFPDLNPDKDVVDCLIFKLGIIFNYYLAFRSRLLQDLGDLDPVIIDFNRGLRIENSKSSYLGFGVSYNYLQKKQINEKIPVIRAIDVFDNLGHKLEDKRDYWHSVPMDLVLLHFFKMTNEKVPSHLQMLKSIQNLKAGNLIVTSNEKKYKIFQVSDLHFLDGEVDKETAELLTKSYSNELPDLVIINGDLVEYSNIDPSKMTAILLRAMNIFIALKVPYVINLGESDYRAPDINRALNFMANLPYCINSVKDTPQEHGLTNYNFKIYHETEVVAVVSVLDSFQNNIENNQINSLYRFNSDDLPAQVFKLAFMHFPLPNFRPTGKFKIIGDYNEKGPLHTSTDKTFIDDFVSLNYHVILASHEHTNDGCISYVDAKTSKEIWLCYSSVTGFQARASPDFSRRFRVFEITGNRLLSWKMKEGLGYKYHLIHKF